MHSSSKIYTPAQLVLHEGTMLLLDTVIDYGPDWIECSVDHHPGCAFIDHQGKIPSWIGLEYMCQAIAALAGVQRLQCQKKIVMGLVLGTKRYNANTPYFYRGQRVSIRVDEDMKNSSNLGVYHCVIRNDKHQDIAQAHIKAIMPENASVVLNNKKEICYE